MRTTLLRALFILAILISISILGSGPTASQPPKGPQLHLHRGTFDARSAPHPSPVPELAAAAPGPYTILQFRGPITLGDRQALEGTGVRISGYVPDFAYLVRGTPTQLEAAAGLPGVYARVPFTPADKLAPALLRALAGGERKLGPLRIVSWPGEEAALANDLRTLGVDQADTFDRQGLLRVAQVPSVQWIEPVVRPRILNDYARAIMNVDPVWESVGWFGAGQVVAVADTGLDTGDLDTLSPDFKDRVVATHALAPAGHWDDNHGHGTHVAGSLAGAGVQSGADPATQDYTESFAGVAPEASLVIQAFEATEDGQIIGLDEDYYQLFATAYGDGARLHSDSWGGYTGPISDTQAAYGAYPYGSQRTDQFVWDHPDMAIFVAAGNEGVDGTRRELFPGVPICLNGDGVIDPDSLLAPGTAKNVITIGASESDRLGSGLGSTPWLLVSFCFSVDPIALDPLADNPDGMAAFSSRGPTDDKRFKPDLVAPGTNIVSNRSHHTDATTLWGAHETNHHYVYSGGTSMATPLAAGAGALVRQWLVSQGLLNPSAAALKATLLNTTRDMAPGQYDIGPKQEIPPERPNSVSGWGRLDLGFMEATAPYALWLDDHTSGLVTGQVISYTHAISRPLQVLTHTQPLRVMLTWTDYPPLQLVAPQLVNDLDLLVIGPGGERYHGNDVTGGDRVNNVEGVIISDPPLGKYQIRVNGFNVPMRVQPYALAVAGPLRDVNEPALTALKTANASTVQVGQTVTYTYRVLNSGAVTLTDVVGSDDKLGPVALNPVTLPPGHHATGTLTYTVSFNDFPGPLVNTVTISGTTVEDPQVVATATGVATVYVRPRFGLFLPLVAKPALD